MISPTWHRFTGATTHRQGAVDAASRRSEWIVGASHEGSKAKRAGAGVLEIYGICALAHSGLHRASEDADAGGVVMRTLMLVSLAAVASVVGACAPAADDVAGDGAGALATTEDGKVHWFYQGPLPHLENPRVVISRMGHTVRVSGLLPKEVELPVDLPHIRTKQEDGRTRVDVVYPISTATLATNNAPPMRYSIEYVAPYRPDGITVTTSDPDGHYVPWGGFPFVPYHGGIAMHGPITPEGGKPVWFLQRGPVSSGCNRMMGEHIIELTHLIGADMEAIYRPLARKRHATDYELKLEHPVLVDYTIEYDSYEGKPVDSEYPTYDYAANPMKRPTGDVEMFGTWFASTTPNDLPGVTKGKGGAPFDFEIRKTTGWVCSMPGDMAASLVGGKIPAGYCQCVTDGGDAKTCFGE